MIIRDEDLIDYLLDEADPVLIRRIELALETDWRVAQRLSELRAALGLLDTLKPVVEPPPDLLSRTLDAIDRQRADDLHTDQPSQSMGEPLRPVGRNQSSFSLRQSEAARDGLRSNRRVWDSAFLTISGVALLCLMLPLVLEARSLSRQLACGDNLRALGQSFNQLAMLDPERRFPSIPLYGPEAFAGRSYMKLRDLDLLGSWRLLQCASLPGRDSDSADVLYVPTTAEYRQANAAQQALWRGTMSDYAYVYGVHDSGRVVGPRLEGRSYFALLGDAPQVEEDCDVFYAHEGRGINLYYEDGHVSFCRLPYCNLDERPQLTNLAKADLSKRALAGAEPATAGPAAGVSSRKAIVPLGHWNAGMDYPFRNLEGKQGYGLNQNDASLGPSHRAPQAR